MFEIDVEANALRATDDLIARLRNPEKALGEVGAYLEGKAKQRFLQEKDPQGNPWAPLAPSTIADKQRRGAPLKILRDRGILMSSIAFRVSGAEVRVGTSQEYAIWLQKGTGKMPSRPFMGFEPTDADAIAGIFRRHIQGD